MSKIIVKWIWPVFAQKECILSRPIAQIQGRKERKQTDQPYFILPWNSNYCKKVRKIYWDIPSQKSELILSRSLHCLIIPPIIFILLKIFFLFFSVTFFKFQIIYQCVFLIVIPIIILCQCVYDVFILGEISQNISWIYISEQFPMPSSMLELMT